MIDQFKGPSLKKILVGDELCPEEWAKVSFLFCRFMSLMVVLFGATFIKTINALSDSMPGILYLLLLLIWVIAIGISSRIFWKDARGVTELSEKHFSFSYILAFFVKRFLYAYGLMVCALNLTIAFSLFTVSSWYGDRMLEAIRGISPLAGKMFFPHATIWGIFVLLLVPVLFVFYRFLGSFVEQLIMGIAQRVGSREFHFDKKHDIVENPKY